MEYKPATAILTTYRNTYPDQPQPVLIEPQDLPSLLSKVADLISQRAARIVHRQLRQASSQTEDRSNPMRTIAAS
jgi:hypothetical protein